MIGIHPNLSDAEYDALPAVRSSHLKLLVPPSTPAHLRECLRNPTRKKAWDLGTAAHLGILRPELLDGRIAVAGQCSATTGKGARCSNGGALEYQGAWFCRTKGHAPAEAAESTKIVLSEDDYRATQRIVEAVWNHPLASAMLKGTDKEVTGVWIDEATEEACKFRMDAVSWAEGLCIDVKTCADADPKSFALAVRNFAYHLSAAHYSNGAAVLRRPIENFAFIAVEKAAPHCVAVYRLQDEVVAEGGRLARQALELYAHCRHLDEWPGYPAEATEIALPEWDMRKLLQEIE